MDRSCEGVGAGEGAGEEVRPASAMQGTSVDVWEGQSRYGESYRVIQFTLS